jgi:hypothetical protein
MSFDASVGESVPLVARDVCDTSEELSVVDETKGLRFIVDVSDVVVGVVDELGMVDPDVGTAVESGVSATE